jgi:hypothetical protein
VGLFVGGFRHRYNTEVNRVGGRLGVLDDADFQIVIPLGKEIVVARPLHIPLEYCPTVGVLAKTVNEILNVTVPAPLAVLGWVFEYDSILGHCSLSPCLLDDA